MSDFSVLLLLIICLLSNTFSLSPPHTYTKTSPSFPPRFSYTSLLPHEKLPDAVQRMVNERLRCGDGCDGDGDSYVDGNRGMCALKEAEEIIRYGAVSVGRDEDVTTTTTTRTTTTSTVTTTSSPQSRPKTSPWYQISTPLPPSTLTTPHLRLLYPVRVFPSLPSTTILHTDDTFVVVDKPTGVPSQPYAGNCKDTLSRFVKDELGLEEEPRLLNRVDLCVSGVVVLSKTKLGRKVWDQMNSSRSVKKEYIAVSKERLGTGVKKVIMCTSNMGGGQGRLPTSNTGKVLLSTDFEGWKNHPSWTRCILNVASVTRIPGVGYEHRVHLVTGRKHQIRATFAHFGATLVGDTLYEGMEGVGMRKGAGVEEVKEMERKLNEGKAPKGEIGLRAVKIMIDREVVNAGEQKAWWRQEVVDL